VKGPVEDLSAKAFLPRLFLQSESTCDLGMCFPTCAENLQG